MDQDKKMDGKPSLHTNLIEAILITAVLAAIVGIGFFFYYIVSKSQNVINIAQQHANDRVDLDYNAVMMLAKVQETSATKITGILLGFILVFTGILLLFKAFRSYYHFTAKNDIGGSLALKSSSPGLIICTLGTIIVIVSTEHKNKIDYVPDVMFRYNILLKTAADANNANSETETNKKQAVVNIPYSDSNFKQTLQQISSLAASLSDSTNNLPTFNASSDSYGQIWNRLYQEYIKMRSYPFLYSGSTSVLGTNFQCGDAWYWKYLNESAKEKEKLKKPL